jgi:Ca-activated chloride channel family protein
VDIVLLVDISNSMREEDFSTATQQHLNRLDAAKSVIGEFVKARKDDRIGMVAFAGLPYTVSPLTLDHGWLIQRMDDLQLGMLGEYGNSTAIGDAIASGINRLRESEAKSKVVVLLTDGNNNAGDISPENAAQAANALGIKIYTVAAGSEWIRVPSLFGGFRKQAADIDMAGLRRISSITDAHCFRARNLKELEKVYEEIDEMEKTKIEVEHYTRFEERFAPFLALGLICLGAEKLLALTRLGRLP